MPPITQGKSSTLIGNRELVDCLRTASVSIFNSLLV